MATPPTGDPGTSNPTDTIKTAEPSKPTDTSKLTEPSKAPAPTQSQGPITLPRLTIRFCTQCKWNLRAAYYAQELLQTFGDALGEVALQPATGGAFVVTLFTQHRRRQHDDRSDGDESTPTTTNSTTEGTSTNADASAGAGGEEISIQRTVLWDRKVDGGFPETKVLKGRVRDVLEPGRSLGHTDRALRKGATEPLREEAREKEHQKDQKRDQKKEDQKEDQKKERDEKVEYEQEKRDYKQERRDYEEAMRVFEEQKRYYEQEKREYEQRKREYEERRGLGQAEGDSTTPTTVAVANSEDGRDVEGYVEVTINGQPKEAEECQDCT